jgi:hypothetical protein
VLLAPEEVALAADAQVRTGDLEAVASAPEDLEALERPLPRLGDEDAVARALAPAHPAAELVELREPEPLGVLDDHYGGVGYVDADLDHRGGDQHVDLAGQERAHDRVTVGGRQLPMDQADLPAREDLGAQSLELVRGRQQVDLLGLRHERVDHVGLAPGRELAFHESVHLRALVACPQRRLDGLAARRDLVEDAQVDVSVERHRERAGNRRR